MFLTSFNLFLRISIFLYISYRPKEDNHFGQKFTIAAFYLSAIAILLINFDYDIHPKFFAIHRYVLVQILDYRFFTYRRLSLKFYLLDFIYVPIFCTPKIISDLDPHNIYMPFELPK